MAEGVGAAVCTVDAYANAAAMNNISDHGYQVRGEAHGCKNSD